MSVGVVVVTHDRIGAEFLHALRQIVPDAPNFQAVSVRTDQSAEEMRSEIAGALKTADAGAGVLVLTDMFGGSPSNMSLSFLDDHHVEVVTGLNLPMLIKLATLSETMALEALARFIAEYGRRNISLASDLLPHSDAEPEAKR